MSSASAYREALIDRIRTATDDLGWAIAPLDEDAARYRPARDEWSIHEQLAHLVDMEQEVYLPLLRWASLPEMLDPRDYNRHEWRERRYRPDVPLLDLFVEFQRIRDEETGIFANMDDATWLALRRDTRWGPLTCQWIAQLIYRHALDHLQGMMALRQDLDLAAAAELPMAGGVIGARG